MEENDVENTIWLSVAVVFCDKDAQYLPALLEGIERNVKIPHEVVLFDNRDDRSGAVFTMVARVVGGEGNLLQFEARRRLSFECKGRYVWFVDADDKVLPVGMEELDTLREGHGFVSFSCGAVRDGGLWFFHGGGESVLKYEKPCVEAYHAAGYMMWNKWVRLDVLQKAASMMPTGLRIRWGEDSLLSRAVMKCADSYRTLPKAFYIYNRNRSSMDRRGMSADDFTSLLEGLSLERELYAKVFPDEEERFAFGFKRYENFFSMAARIKDCIAESEWEKALDALLEHYEPWEFDAFYKTGAFSKDKDFRKFLHKRFYEMKTEGAVCYPTHPDRYTLSIVCLIYDGSKQHTRRICDMVSENVLIPHELIIVDNRDDNKERLDAPGAKVVSAGKNIGILNGRRIGAETATGDYVWFIDSDDCVPVVHDSYNLFGADLAVFGWEYSNYVCRFSQSVIDGPFSYSDYKSCLSNALWNKWIKRSLLEKVYSLPYFPRDEFVIFHEDAMVLLCVVGLAEKTVCHPDLMYVHMVSEDSVTASPEIDSRRWDLMFTGFDAAMEFHRKSFADGTMKIGLEEFLNGDLSWQIRQLKRTEKDAIGDAKRLLLEKYGEERIRGCIAGLSGWEADEAKAAWEVAGEGAGSRDEGAGGRD